MDQNKNKNKINDSDWQLKFMEPLLGCLNIYYILGIILRNYTHVYPSEENINFTDERLKQRI